VATAKVLWVLTSCNLWILRYWIDFLGWLPRSVFLWVQRVSTSSPNICINCFIAFHILVIVCLWLIKYLIPHYIVIHLFNPPSRYYLESGLYFHLLYLMCTRVGHLCALWYAFHYLSKKNLKKKKNHKNSRIKL
jgi:hypothetical protein